MAEDSDGLIPLGPKSAAPDMAASPVTDPTDPLRPIGGPLSTSYDKVPSNDHGAGIISDVGRGLGLGTRDMINAATGLPAAVADVATFLPRMGIRAAGGTATAPSDMWQAALDRILPRPETEGEKLRSAINEAAGATIGPMALGTAAPRLAAAIPAGPRALIATDAPVASLPLAASQVAAGGAGGAAGEVLANDERVPEWLKPSARLAGNMIGTGVVSALTGAAGTIGNAIQGVKTPIAEALERLGIVPRTVGAVTDRPGLQKTEAVFSGTPVAAGQLQPAQRQMVDDFGNAVHGTAQMLDPTIQNPITSAERAGNVVQPELMNWKNNTFPAEQAALWNPLSQRIAGATVTPSNFRTALEQTARDPALNSLPAHQQAFIQARLQTWLDALNADVPRGGNYSWEQAMAVKRRIGDEMGRPDLVGDVGTTALKNVYGGLAGDMRTTAAAHGQEALFDAANRVTTEGHQFLNGTAAKAVRANNPMQETIRPDTAARSLLEDNTGMQQLRDRVPVAADALAAWKLRDMMTPVASSQGDVSTGSFLTNLRKQARSDPEGQAALFTDPAVAQNVRDLGTVANQFRSVEKNANASKTGLTNYVLGAAGGLGGALTSGNLAAALSVLGGSVGAPYVAGKMLTSPAAIALASARAGPRPPINSRVAGLLGYLANQ